MSVNIEGIEAEQKARPILQASGFDIQQLDWIGKKDNKWLIFEVKQRELFQAPPFDGTGLDIKQINLRRKLFNDLGIDTYLLVFEKGTENIYGEYLFNKLEKTKYFDTKNQIRIYNLINFKKLNK